MEGAKITAESSPPFVSVSTDGTKKHTNKGTFYTQLFITHTLYTTPYDKQQQLNLVFKINKITHNDFHDGIYRGDLALARRQAFNISDAAINVHRCML